jgi:peptide/nickel transport system ATP-binding protein/oligopeptide transport system ATP-binding protein
VTLLVVDDLRKTYKGKRSWKRESEPIVAVDDVNFELDAGKTLAVVGESGAGKSTTGLLVLRLVEPDSGSILLDGIDFLALSPPELRQKRLRMQMIFQDPQSSLDPRISLGRSVAEPLKVHFGMNRVDREEKAAEVLDKVGLGRDLLRRYPHELSGGQLQRVAIARALTLEPALLVCDEPVSALDVSVRAQVLNLLLELQAEMGLAYLFISHDLSVVEAVAHDVLVMSAGRIVERGTNREVYENPQHPYTKELLAAVPITDPSKRKSKLRPAGAGIEPTGGAANGQKMVAEVRGS